MTTKLVNGYGILKDLGGHHVVKAIFRGEIEIVFEGSNREECIKYCHNNGMRAIDEDRYNRRINPWFVKKNAKHPFNPDDWKIGVVA